MNTSTTRSLALSLLSISFAFLVSAQDTDMFESFPVKWEVNMGNTSHRTNIELTDNYLIIGSNGMHYMDSREDEKAGVYLINNKTGKVDKVLAGAGTGDLDVCGVLVHQNYLYFGNDNGEFFCYNLNGQLIWKNYCSGEVEHAPVMLNRYGRKALVYTSECGEIRAVNPYSGKTIWVNYPNDYVGWKPEDGVNYMQVTTTDKVNRIYFTKPSVVDLNKDGNDDLIFNLYDSETVGISGVNGGVSFRIKQDYFTRYEVILAGNSSDRLLTFNHKAIPDPKSSTKEGNIEYIPYIYPGYVQVNNLRGDSIGAQMISDFEWNGEKSLNHFKKDNGNIVVATKADILEISASGRIVKKLRRSETYVRKSYYSGDVFTTEFLGGGNSLLSTDAFTYQGHKCLFLMDQNQRLAPDGLYAGKAKITLFKEDLSAILGTFVLPSTSEFAPVVKDVDKDGAKDLIVSLRDGKLYCLTLESINSLVQNK